jgi:hypothetical protein
VGGYREIVKNITVLLVIQKKGVLDDLVANRRIKKVEKSDGRAWT